MSAVTVVELQSRLDALMILLAVENGERGVDIQFEGFSDQHHWSIDVSNYDGGSIDDTPTVERYSLEHVKFSGVGFADAVEAMWLHYGSPVLCPDCDGEGSFHLWGDKIPADADESWNIRIDHTGLRVAHRDCPTCHGDRFKLGDAP